MAIVKNFWLVNQKKKLGGAVIYQAMGQTRSRELAASVSNPRTQSQMSQRVKWANLVNLYRANKSWMKFAYETKKQNQSEYNKFMSLNVSNSRIYLPKSLANQGACVVDAYTMTQGSLSSIEITPRSGGWLSNIFLGSSNVLTQNVTIGEVAQAVIANNPAIREGDQLSFIRLTQQTNSSTGVPYVVVRRYEVILRSDDPRPFFEFLPAGYIQGDASGAQYVIGVQDSGNAGGFLLILSRTVGGKTYVSTQDIIVANNAAMIEAYSSPAALQAAIDSYGESDEPFLTSSTAEENNQAQVPTSVVSVAIDDVSYPLGQRASIAFLAQDASIEVRLSEAISPGTEAEATLKFWQDGVLVEADLINVAVSGNILSGALDSSLDFSNISLQEIDALIGDVEYRGVWVVPNSATGGGLE